MDDEELDESAGDVPDWVSLYPVVYDPEAERILNLTPRAAALLWTEATLLADMWRDVADGIGDRDMWIELLPPVARAYADGIWLQRFAECFRDLADRLAAATVAYPSIARCTGDEVAFHIVCDHAEDAVSDSLHSEIVSGWEALPDHGEIDTDVEWFRSVLSYDEDVLMLYEPALDGVEVSDAAVEARTVDLHPSKWFLPFGTDDEGP